MAALQVTPCQRVTRQANKVLCRMALIAVLLGASGPFTIGTLIANGIVNTVDRVCDGRTCSHVIKEDAEGVQPAIADRNALGSIPRVSGITSTVATGFHGLPTAICRGLAQAVLQFGSGRTKDAAPAASGRSSLQRLANNIDDNAAVAAAPPHGLLVPVGPCALNHGEHSRTEAGQVGDVPSTLRHEHIVRQMSVGVNIV